MSNCIVAQSGGPTVAINASLAGVLKANEESRQFEHVYGSLNGITGILDDRLIDLTSCIEKDPEFIDRLTVTPAMYLGSCRYKMPQPGSEEGNEIYTQIFKYFEEYDVDTFFYIGGNDSMDTVMQLSKYASMIGSSVKVLGIPKTIDNDLCHTDHTPGFGSAAKYVAASVREVAHDAYIYGIKSVTIIEIMGRDAGWLTAASALARTENSPAPHLIYLPETAFDIKKCIADVKELLEYENNVIIAISEGIRDSEGRYISTTDAGSDIFGHNHLSGAGKSLENILKIALEVKVRSIEINVLQRCASHLASLTDLEESKAQGAYAVAMAKEGHTGEMMTITRKEGDTYETAIGSFPIDQIANGVKNVPREWINEEGNDVTEEMIDYLRPLILGEPAVSYKDGLPDYLEVPHLI